MESMSSTTRARATRQRLIQTAAKRFASHGYHGTSYSDLIAASGLSKGAFYFHFPSKQDLALEVYRAKQKQLIESSMTAGRGESSPFERIFRVLEARAQAFASDRSLRCLPRLSTDFARDPDLKAYVAQLHRGAIDVLAGLLTEARDAGEVREEIDPGAAARTIFATIVGLDEVSERESGGKDLVDRSHEFLALLRLALTPPE